MFSEANFHGFSDVGVSCMRGGLPHENAVLLAPKLNNFFFLSLSIIAQITKKCYLLDRKTY